MIVEMEKMFLYGLFSDNQKILSRLLKLGCVQINSPEQLPEYQQLSEIMQYKAADLYDLEQHISRCQSTIAALRPFAPPARLLDHKPRVGFSCLQDDGQIAHADEVCESAESFTRTIADYKNGISKEEFTKTSLQPWASLDLPLELGGTAETAVEYVILPASADLESISAHLEEQKLTGYLYLQSADKDQQYALLICHKGDRAAVWELLRTEGAVRYNFDGIEGTPAQGIARCDQNIADLNEKIDETNSQLKETATEIGEVKLAYDVLKMRYDCAKAYQNLLHTDKTFLLTAWVPKEKEQEVSAYLDELSCYYEFAPAAPGEEFPVKLKNSKLVEPFEVVTEMYSLPACDSVDPDPFMALFFFIFFGMMLSDAGYGLLLVFGGLFALKKMDLTPFSRKFMKLIVYGGISTVIWGALYGSWFGNLIPVVASTFFGKTVTVPFLLDPLNDPITILVISFALGIVHLFTGMGLKAYLLIKRGQFWDAVFDVFFWYGFLVGLGMLFLPGTARTVGKWMAIACAIGLVLTQGRDKKNVFMRLMSGVVSLYGVTGYFSDVLSYSRILALGLATGVIANVVNTMGALPGANIIGVIVFILVFLGGHAMNLAINALGSFVHTARLQYVEFFGKFFEGGGKPFSPLRANTKYVCVTDEEE